MLILSRKEGERILIGAGIEVTVLGVSNGKVRLGLSAPPEVSIFREELRQSFGAGGPRRSPSQASSVAQES